MKINNKEIIRIFELFNKKVDMFSIECSYNDLEKDKKFIMSISEIIQMLTHTHRQYNFYWFREKNKDLFLVFNKEIIDDIEISKDTLSNLVPTVLIKNVDK